MCARTNPVVTVGHAKQQAVVDGALVVVDVVGAAVVVTGAVVSGDVVDVP